MDYNKVNEAAEGYDFAKAKRFQAAKNDGIYSVRAIYAQDAEGICYEFPNAFEAADKVIKCGYSRAAQRAVRLNIIKAARKNGGRKNGVIYGFAWHFVDELDNK